jgi:hypothetical protein
MENPVGSLQDFLIHMSIYLGCGNIRVTQKFLYGAEIRPVPEQMGGKGVAQPVYFSIRFYSK